MFIGERGSPKWLPFLCVKKQANICRYGKIFPILGTETKPKPMKAIPEGHTHRLSDNLELDIEFYRWPAEDGDRITPGTPEMFELDSVWLVDRNTKDVIDITDAEGDLWQHDQIMQIIQNKYGL